jgi:CMP-N-acetylneuraminic acid synthetase
MPRTIIFIPARSGSKRIPNKNTRLIVGQASLLDFTIGAAHEYRENFSKDALIYVSTDDDTIACLAESRGALIDMRPALLAADEAAATDAAIDFCERRALADDDILVMLQPTTPVRDPAHIAVAVDAIAQGAPAAISATEPPHMAALVMATVSSGWRSLTHAYDAATVLPKREGFEMLKINGSIFAASVKQLTTHMTFMIEAAFLIKMDALHSVEVDYPSDITLAQAAATWGGE